MPLIRTLREAEREAVKRSADETDTRALSWLFSVSSNPSVQRIVAESTGALPIRSVTSVQCYAEGLPRVCTFTLKELLDDAHRNDVLAATNKMDRCIRTHLRFQFRNSDVLIQKYDKRDQLAPDLRAELLAAEPYGGSQNALGLIVATLRTPANSQSLHLQPVVCGCLLSKILPLNWEVYELLFHALPTFYWSTVCKLPLHFYPAQGLRYPQVIVRSLFSLPSSNPCTRASVISYLKVVRIVNSRIIYPIMIPHLSSLNLAIAECAFS
ncbi:hypothetical protein EV421DRAFT_1103985 [Armillaria borealis]|uniref:Uncharacterized protein n=1 Tax=Armillaria borealis TaxID=47425 RepID=A0AA39MK13_9AGAR|nr:hypothetical protein EV421DRAFT_1103985 [Armillaria borealis]